MTHGCLLFASPTAGVITYRHPHTFGTVPDPLQVDYYVTATCADFESVRISLINQPLLQPDQIEMTSFDYPCKALNFFMIPDDLGKIEEPVERLAGANTLQSSLKEDIMYVIHNYPSTDGDY